MPNSRQGSVESSISIWSAGPMPSRASICSSTVSRPNTALPAASACARSRSSSAFRPEAARSYSVGGTLNSIIAPHGLKRVTIVKGIW